MARMKTKAQFFIIDALIALAIIILTVIVILPTPQQSKAESSASADILQSLSSLKIGEIDNTYAKTLISDGKVTDLEKSVLDQIGEFYITNITIARQLSEEVLAPISPNENIGIWYGSQLLASRNITPFETAENILTERQVISGIGGGDGVTGFSARAFLSSSARTDYAYFGGYIGEGNISTLVEYQGTITSATIELVINDIFTVYVNGVNSGSYSASPNEFTPVTHNISIANFASGTNTVEIVGEDTHIAGGFIKIIYDSEVTYEQPEKYKFPGIQGAINLYDGFYIPGNLTKLAISLHFNNSVSTFLTLGKTKIFNGTSDGTTPITITNSTLSSLFNYADISRKTIPIRFGMEDQDYAINMSRDIDVFSVTDLSGSMCGTCSGGAWLCCWSGCSNNQQKCESCGGTCTAGIYEAKSANNLFIDMITNDTADRVGLVGYETNVDDYNCHDLSNNNASLKNKVSGWMAYGNTCICCGINKAINGTLANSTSAKFRSIVVMSDGEANVQCPQQPLNATAKLDAIQAACDAYNKYGIKVYAVGFGASADTTTLTAIATCGGGSYYSAISNITSIYEKIAEEIIATSFYEQTVIVTGDFYSELYPDSYIEFEYEKESPPVGIVATIEQPFSTSDSAAFNLPSNSTILSANVISYSGPRWTSSVTLNGNNLYNLNDYNEDYLLLGDPYSINLPKSLVQNNNNLTLRTALSEVNDTGGSINNKVIYTISKELASYTSVSATADGCDWTMQFENYNLTMPIPSNYSGSENCKYASDEIYCDIYTNCYGASDAIQIATYNIFKLLDFNLDGIIDVELSEDNMQISTSSLEGVPFLYSTEVQIRKWR
jgi:hypothetical protein